VAAALEGTAIDGGEFADNVAVADMDERFLALVGNILGVGAQGSEGEDQAVFADKRVLINGDMVPSPMRTPGPTTA
jgi:hypothetical protein